MYRCTRLESVVVHSDFHAPIVKDVTNKEKQLDGKNDIFHLFTWMV